MDTLTSKIPDTGHRKRTALHDTEVGVWCTLSVRNIDLVFYAVRILRDT
jgi:hypothetical protein